ncbi:MAG: MFS transporter [Haloarculaceae archaeon]
MSETGVTESPGESLVSGYSGRVFVAIAVGWAGLRLGRGVLPPLLPAVIDGLAISPFRAGLALTTMTALNAGFQFLGGRFADAWTRKTVIAASLGVLLVGLAVLSGAVTYALLLVGAAVVGVAGGLFFVPMRAALADVFVARRGRAYGINEGVGSLATVGAAGIAAVVVDVTTWRTAFLPGLALAAVGLVVLHYWHRESYVVGRTRFQFRGTAANVLGDPRTRLVLLAYSLVVFAMKGAFGFLPTFLQAERSFSPALASGAYALLFVTGAVGMPLSGALSDRTDRRTVAVAFVVVAAVGLAAIVAAPAKPLILVAVAVFAGGILGFPPVVQAYLMDRFPDETMGRDFGGFKTVYLAVGSAGPAFVGYVADTWGYAPAYLSLAGCLVAAATVIGWVLHRRV